MIAMSLYEPRRLNEEDFLSGFIARQELYEFLLRQLSKVPVLGEARHRMIVGQRGMGKTSLLRRLAIGLARDPELKERLLPLTFREEQYNVRSLDQFWRNCGEALAEWLEQSGDAAGAERLDREMRQPDWQQPETAGEAFQARVEATGRRPVLLVDNLDLVLEALPDPQRWQLRRALQAADGPVLYGAAVQALKQSGDQQAAFYEFFRIDLLEPLTANELRKCLRRLALSRGEAGVPVTKILQAEPQRLRVLHTLTGGNPRILTLIYQLLERADSTTVFGDLESLLDQLTPFYKARVEELRTELQRAVLDAVALHWDPVTSNALAEITGVEITTLSSQLSRLKNQGLIEEVPTSGARAGYQLVERFFNIWYLMRHGTRRTRHRMRWLTTFLQVFYSGEELQTLRNSLTEGSRPGSYHPLYAEALDAAVEASARTRPAIASTIRPDDGWIAAQKQTATAHIEAGLYVEAEQTLRQIIRQVPEGAAAWHALGILLMDPLGRPGEAEPALREALRLDPNDVGVWNNLGILLMDHLGRPGEAEAAYREALRLDPNDARAWYNLGVLLARDLGRPGEAEAAYREALRLDPNDVRAWYNLAILLMDLLGRPGEAEAAYREALRLDPNDALAWHNLGILLVRDLGRPGEAEAAYREALRLDPNDARAWSNLGALLMDPLGRPGEAEPAYREALRLDPNNARAWNGLGNLLVDHLGRPEEGDAAYAQAIALGGEAGLYALANRFWLLLDQDRGDEARTLRAALTELEPLGLLIADAGLELAGDNFGAASGTLDRVLDPDRKVLSSAFFDDVLRLLRLFERRGYGERLIEWLERSGHHDRQAPLYAAFVAYVRGERRLLDVNPEVRQPAERLYGWLNSRRPPPPPSSAAKKRRGRPRGA